MTTNNSGPWNARAAALDILQSERVAVVATSFQDRPWASTVYYVDAGFVIYVNTPNSTTMLRNLLVNPNVSFAIDERRPTFFLQATGNASVVVDPAELAQVTLLFAVKVPEAHVGADDYTLVRIDTDRVYVSDLRDGYRPRAEVEVDRAPSDV